MTIRNETNFKSATTTNQVFGTTSTAETTTKKITTTSILTTTTGADSSQARNFSFLFLVVFFSKIQQLKFTGFMESNRFLEVLEESQ